MGRPVTPISSDYVTKRGTRYNITRNNIDYGNYIKIEIKTVLNILESIDWDYDVWMDMKTKNIPEDELKKTIHEFLSNDTVFTTREISEHINKKYNKYYSVEYTRTLLRRFKESESWLMCKNNNKNNYRGIPLTWSVI
jgi:predicted transcriptional regulator